MARMPKPDEKQFEVDPVTDPEIDKTDPENREVTAEPDPEAVLHEMVADGRARSLAHARFLRAASA